MKTKLNTLLNRVDTRLAACAAAAGASLVAPSIAQAVIVDSGVQNINVPNTFDGIYLNFVTGATGTSGSTVSGWDWNPYNSGTSLSFFWAATPSQAGGVSATATGPYLNLATGTLVSGASIFSSGTATANTAAFQNTTGFLGFRFFNESTSAINYGYVQLSSTGGNGFPLSIVRWFYQNDGTGITIPTGTVPEGGSTLALLVLAIAGVAAARKLTRSGEAKA